jgi:hypothetical protein
MSEAFSDVLGRLMPTARPETIGPAARQVEALAQQMADVLVALDPAAASAALAYFAALVQRIVAERTAEAVRRLDDEKPPGREAIPSDVLAWARQQFTEEEIVAGLRELRATGGLELSEFIGELEQEAKPGG